MKTTIYSNMSAAEEYRLTGTVTGKRLETLLEDSERLEKVLDAESYLEEAKGGFPDEDFLASTIAELTAIAKKLRGGNAEDLRRVIFSMEDLANAVNQSAEYGQEELDQALECFNA